MSGGCWEGEILAVGPEGPTTDRLLNALLGEGIKAHHSPFTKIVPTPERVQKQFQPPYSISVFCSAHAVSSFSSLLKENAINFSHLGELIAQGPTTATALTQLLSSLGIKGATIHQICNPPYSSPQIFDLICGLVQGEWKEEKMAVFQSDKGVDFLLSQGREKGADCHSIHCYTTCPITYPPSSLPLCEFVIISSLQQLSLWTSFIHSNTKSPDDSLEPKQYQQTKVIATSQRILSEAEKGNFSCLLSPSHDAESFVSLLKSFHMANLSSFIFVFENEGADKEGVEHLILADGGEITRRYEKGLSGFAAQVTDKALGDIAENKAKYHLKYFEADGRVTAFAGSLK
uniref:Uroporphyrinogen III synthase n=1 Tax=Paramoeba pemaquidensis TaxID=180228 RepID=A0A167HDB4_9EUKA|nr:uroporphyrinogen III synthase [Paramoeba pemaquidensis]